MSSSLHSPLASSITCISFIFILILVVGDAVMSTLIIDKQPPIPIWPSSFSVSFYERMGPYPIVGEGNTTGVWYYDFPSRSERIDRVNGEGDHWCYWLYPNINTECRHYIVNNTRYLYYPQQQYCCKCCSSPGCGIVQPNWLQMVNATYVGVETITVNNNIFGDAASATDAIDIVDDVIKSFNYTCDKWDGKASGFHPLLSDNYVWIEQESNLMLQLFQQNCNDLQVFDLSSYILKAPPPDVFRLPTNNVDCQQQCPSKVIPCTFE